MRVVVDVAIVTVVAVGGGIVVGLVAGGFEVDRLAKGSDGVLLGLLRNELCVLEPAHDPHRVTWVGVCGNPQHLDICIVAKGCVESSSGGIGPMHSKASPTHLEGTRSPKSDLRPEDVLSSPPPRGLQCTRSFR
jgi:hypothetical protein